MADAALQTTIERLNARYAAAIDDDRLEDWPGFFALACRYQIITRENYERKLPVAIFFADSRAMLEDRVASLRQANIYEAQYYRHVLAPSLILGVADGMVTAQTNYQVVRTMQDGAMSLFSVGRYLDRIMLGAPEPLFQEKLVICDSRRIDTLLAIPL
jgi:3-phenylpropionate/cinnamic acid dioxygenase small subunit